MPSLNSPLKQLYFATSGVVAVTMFVLAMVFLFAPEFNRYHDPCQRENGMGLRLSHLVIAMTAFDLPHVLYLLYKPFWWAHFVVGVFWFVLLLESLVTDAYECSRSPVWSLAVVELVWFVSSTLGEAVVKLP